MDNDLKERCNQAFERMRKDYRTMTTSDFQTVAQFISILLGESDEDITTLLRCGDCGKIMDDSNTRIINPPVTISKWDIEHDYKRDRAYVCCDKFRMINQDTNELLAFTIPDNVVLSHVKGETWT